MKKLLAFTAVALAMSMTPALADNHSDKGGKGKMFEKHDTNGDGVISKDEFMSHAEERFGGIDADGNGEISQDEAKAKRAEMKDKMKERKEKRQERREERQDSSDE